MPKELPPEFKRDVANVARRGDLPAVGLITCTELMRY